MLTQERLKELLDYDPDTGAFTWKVNRTAGIKVGDIAGTNNQGYIMIRVDGKKYSAHRLAWLYVYGCWPTNEIDHINRVRGDNRSCNLREVTKQENGWNQSMYKSNKSGFTGVHWSQKESCWVAQIQKRGSKMTLGRYDTPEEANAAYVRAKAEYHKF